MRNAVLIGLVLALSPLATVAQEVPTRGQRPRHEAAQERRAELEQQFHRQFVARAAESMALSNAQQQRLHQVIQAGAEARRELARESRQLRGEIMQAVRAQDTPMATYQRLLDQTSAMREQEHALARREDAALAEFLDPRQHAMFLVMRMQMMDQVRGMRGGRQAPGTGPGRP